MSPHAMLQDYLNRTEHLWAIVTNGSTLRLLRDSSYFTRPSFIEFDLKQMLEGERLDEFFIFYRLVHCSRLPKTMENGDGCLLEKYHQLGIEQGGRIRDGLRDAVTNAIIGLGRGFLQHRKNDALREAVASGRLAPQQYYQQLLYTIYRLLFLMVAEERNLLRCEGALPPAAVEARRYFTIGRLRDLATEPLSAPERFDDLYLNLQALFMALCKEEYAATLGLPPLNGELFDCQRTSDIGTAYLDNRTLRDAMFTMSYFSSREERLRRRVNYGALDVEELGSVYESLLDFQPIMREENGRFTFDLGTGTERKTTGSYYTRPELVQELIKSALEPVIADRLDAAKPNQREQALLALKVCDPACGSGHFILAAARRIGTELAKVRTGEEAPAPDAVREAVRDVITHCIYGVDKNPLAVDLCKVALWIEGHSGGKPLTFLDHRIRCGDSLVGVFDLSVLEQGIPDGAYTAATGDSKAVVKAMKARNKQERGGQHGLPFDVTAEVHDLREERRMLEEISDDTPDDIHRKRQAFEDVQQQGGRLWRERLACNMWTSAFFAELTPEAQETHRIPTTTDLRRFMDNPDAVDARLRGHVWAIGERNRFFHWPLEFPEVFEQGGFDCVLSNPPWERIKLQEKEFFAARDPEIANAPNKAARQRLIEALQEGDPTLLHEFRQELRTADAQSQFLRQSGRYPLTGRGDVNTYAVFAELGRRLTAAAGRAGIIVPTGIVTDDGTKAFFEDMVVGQSLVQILGFENEAFIFSDVHNEFKFCGLITAGADHRVAAADLVFFCRYFHQLRDPQRHFSLSTADISLLNPNTHTCPVFRTRADAELAAAVYRRVPVWANTTTGVDPWGVRFKTLFHMANDSGLFRPSSGPGLVPLYEAKMVGHFDHRYASLVGQGQAAGRISRKYVGWYSAIYEDPNELPVPRYWVASDEVEKLLPDWTRGWLLCFRDVASSVVERTAVFSLVPRTAVGHKAPLVFVADTLPVTGYATLLANMDALCLDYLVRQKVGGTSLSYFILKQLPILPPDAYTAADLLFIVPRVVELTYTAWDIKAFADDVWREGDDALRQALQQQWEANRSETGGHEWAEIAADGCPLPPFRWSDDRRAVLRAELDAWYARLYGLTRKQLRYILDPHGLSERELADILDPWEDPTCQGPHLLPAEPAEDFPGETFRVLKNKDEAAYGEYRTRRLVLEAWERQGHMRQGEAE